MRTSKAAVAERACAKRNIRGMSDEKLVPSFRRVCEITSDPNFYLTQASRMMPGVEVSYEGGKLTIDISKIAETGPRIGESLSSLLGRISGTPQVEEIDLTEQPSPVTLVD